MTSKDRLEEFRRVAGLAEGARVYADTTLPVAVAAPAGAAGAPGGAADTQFDELLLEVERVRGWVAEVARGAQLVRRLHRDPTFHTNQQLQQQLDAAVTASHAAGLKVLGALRQLEARAAAGAGAGAGGGGAARRAARLHAAAARRQYAAALEQHHAALHALRTDQRQLLHRHLKLTNLQMSEEECEGLLDADNIALFVGNVQAETADARRALRDVEARHEELARVEGSLRAVRDLFAHLAHLIAAQQEQVDSVEYYALQAGERVEGGGQELLKGAVTRKRTRKKKISLIICLASGFLLVLLVLIFT